jgi:hypothetical protein
MKANSRAAPVTSSVPATRISRWVSIGLCLVVSALSVFGAERVFDLTRTPEGQLPPAFRSTVSGEGEMGDWRIRYEDSAALHPTSPQSSVATRHALLAQSSQDPTDERFPLLIYEGERYGDFTFTTRLRTVAGQVAQMAGVAFRIQDEYNYYVLRISSLGNTVAFYKFVNGIRTPPITAQVDIPIGSWHELTVECRANQIRCLLNGREIFPVLTDNSFLDGYVGFWTKSDAVSHFADPRITYTPREILGDILVREIMDRYPRLIGVKILAPVGPDHELRIVASNNPDEVGTPGSAVDHDVVNKSATFFGKDKQIAEVALPLHDRNGVSVAAVRVLLRRSAGQTQASALSRARPVAALIQNRMQSAGDLIH